MKTSLLAIAAILVATSAGAEVRPYLGADLDGTARLGLDFGDIRAEGNLAYTHTKTDKDNDKTVEKGITLWGFYDIGRGALTPFVGLGVGYNTGVEVAPGEEDKVLTYGAQIGVAYEIVKSFNLEAAVKYEVAKLDELDAEATSTGLRFGGRYTF